MSLGKTIKRLRFEKGWTQEDVSRKLGVTSKAISFYELDKRKPSSESLIKIAEVFGITLDELVKGDVKVVRDQKTPRHEHGLDQGTAWDEAAQLDQKTPRHENDLARDMKKILIDIGVVTENTTIAAEDYDEWLRFIRHQAAAFRDFKNGNS